MQPYSCFFLFYWYADPRYLHSFPTRRSSDLISVFLVPERARCPVGRWTDSAKVDRKSTRLNSSHVSISYAVFCLKKKSARDLADERNLAPVHQLLIVEFADHLARHRRAPEYF